ncbi:Hypothetical protein NTJ_02018 [Nesidiocoris tenuis]|uniref:Uncharacterized protein n=1 Tax=Nesidiocoris tenuis TaxID=355587 RepID=A0ABN7AA87_9HEMI|nr:Hypothetical protein NTJ_02018 [Nesidiocoris tenuis]
MEATKGVCHTFRLFYRTVKCIFSLVVGARGAYRKFDGMIRIKQNPRDAADDEKRLARNVVLSSLFSFCCAVALIRATPFVLTRM